MSLYRIKARRHTHPRLGEEGLSAAVINWLIPDARIIELSESSASELRLALELERDDYQSAISEISVALQQAGYSLFNAEVSELVERTVGAIVTGAVTVGCGAGFL